MYCKRCGKFIDYEADMCNECAAEQNAAIQADAFGVQPQVKEGSMKTGLGKAIAAAILGTVALMFIEIALIIMEMGSMDLMFESDLYYAAEAMVEVGAGMFVLLILAAGCAIPSLILSIKSIKTFKAEGAEGRVKPIPTLVLGIYGVVNAAASLLCVVLLMFVVFVMMTIGAI